MLKEKDLDIVLIATPDHWHALPMIAAVEAGADVYVQKPISVDVIEGQAMLAAARKHKRVVQVGTQRRSTPHLIEARDDHRQGGQAGQGRPSRDLLLLRLARRRRTRRTAPRRITWITRCGPARRPMRPYNRMKHPRGWRSFMEYGNGIVGDMCIHMLDTVRWMLDLGSPKTVSSSGGILMYQGPQGQHAGHADRHFDFGDLQVVWQHRTLGRSRPTRNIRGALRSTATRAP